MAEESYALLLVGQRFYFCQQLGVREIIELERVNQILLHFHNPASKDKYRSRRYGFAKIFQTPKTRIN
jgi:hypothetical protein